MTSATLFQINFPSKPKLVFREEGKVTFIDETGEAASIALTTKDVPPLEAAVIYQRRGMDDVRMFAGPAEKIIAAFRDFEVRATAPAQPDNGGTGTGTAARPLMIGASIAIVVLAIGIVNYLAGAQNASDPSAGKFEMLERLSKQVEQLSGDPGRPAPGLTPSASPLMPPGSPMNFKPAKVKQAGPDASPPAPPQAQPPGGAVAVPKELPSLPRAEANPDVVAAVTDGIQTKEPASPEAKITIAVASAPATSPDAGWPSATQVNVGGGTKPEDRPEAKAEPKSEDKSKDGKADERIAPSGVAPMTPAEAQELLKTLEQIKTQAAEGGELTPDLLKQLPMDVARRLVGTGIATVSPQERSERAQRMARIVRLPPSIINKYRGKDGIASIPEQDSWVANGGRISIPLPGGGDILEPGILKEFGLEP
jgi:hypothetical protein